MWLPWDKLWDDRLLTNQGPALTCLCVCLACVACVQQQASGSTGQLQQLVQQLHSQLAADKAQQQAEVQELLQAHTQAAAKDAIKQFRADQVRLAAYSAAAAVVCVGLWLFVFFESGPRCKLLGRFACLWECGVVLLYESIRHMQ